MVRKRTAITGVALLVAALFAAGAQTLPAAAATSSASVTVNATAGLGTVPAHAIGLNTAVYDGDMNDTAIPPLLKAAGIDAMRYPGGSYSDIYNWQTQTAAAGGFVSSNSGFSNFMTTANAAGAQPIITVNYGTGTPSLAAAWVQAAASDGVGYWEVGNEVYGNGTYGANWEADARCETSLNGPAVTIGSEPSQTFDCGPAQYAANVLQYQSAMHAANANAKVCAILTTPGFWPDGVTNSEYPQSWNQTVLSALGSQTQCVVVHYYPGGSSTAGMLTDPTDIAGIVSTLHSELSQYAGITSPASIPILVTETNSTINMDTQPAALFGADMYMTWLENGTTNVDWWNEHNGAGTVSTVNGATDYGDQGIFSNGSSIGGTTEPAADTPFAPYYGIEMLSKLAAPGDTMVNSSSTQTLLKVHAVRDTAGNLNVLIDNEDPSNSYTVSLAYNGFTPNGTPTVYTLANNATTITSASGSSSSATVAPYTLTVVHIPSSGGNTVTVTNPGTQTGTVGTAASLQVQASDSAAGQTLTYSAAGLPAGLSINSSTGLITGTPTTSGNNTATVTVKDGTGATGTASFAWNISGGSGGGGTCHLVYTLNSSWPGGFTAQVVIGNTGTATINTWTLTWTWPGDEVLTSNFNGGFSQNGENATLTPASYNATITPGATVTVGFQGTWTNSVANPTSFSLNGTTCT